MKTVKQHVPVSEQVFASSAPTCYSTGEHLKGGNQNDNDGKPFVGQALTNYVVLKNMMSNLENDDLESCCQVNELWNSVADPLLVRYYYIRLNYSGRLSHPVTLKTRATYKSKQTSASDYTFDDARELLDAAVTAERVAINLKIRWYEGNESAIMNFLSKFGRFVEAFNVRHLFTTRAFCKVIVDYLPNLKCLSFFGTSFEASDENFDENLQNRMKYLRKITNFSNEDISNVQLGSIVRLAHNLDEIYDFPILLVDTLIEYQKVSCVKSLAYQEIGTMEEYHAALEKLSNLELKLNSFSFEDLGWEREVSHFFVHRILQSSYDCLESLTLYKTESFDFEAIPPMSSLQKLTLLFNDQNSINCPRNLFSKEIELKRLFPNVSVVKIPTFMYNARYSMTETSTGFWSGTDSWRQMEDLAALFPENQFLPWGLQVKELKLTDVSVNILQQLSRPFPSVKNLKFYMAGNTNDFQLLFPATGHCWPDLERLTVVVSHPSFCRGLNFGNQEWTLDSVLTGIPDNVLAKLREMEPRKFWFSEEDIREFRESSTMRRFNNLKILKFDFQEGELGCKFMEKLSAVTSVSKEFGFQFLPELKVTVRLRGSKSKLASNMQISLETIGNFEVESTD